MDVVRDCVIFACLGIPLAYVLLRALVPLVEFSDSIVSAAKSTEVQEAAAQAQRAAGAVIWEYKSLRTRTRELVALHEEVSARNSELAVAITRLRLQLSSSGRMHD